MRNIKMFLSLCGLILSLTTTAQTSRNSAKAVSTLPPQLDNYINKVLDAFDVPGAGVAIVKDGQILLSKGYGVKQLGQTDPVDENTLFSIASNSKAFKKLLFPPAL